MKIKLLPALFLVLAVSSLTFSQVVKITPKKTVYTRKGKVSLPEKRRFTITYPAVSGAISPALKKQLDSTLSYWHVFETSLSENLSGSDWLTAAYYKINYNKNGVLDISLTQEGVGAYPDAQSVNLVIDLSTGKPVKFNEVFKSASRLALAQLINRKLELEKREIIAAIDGDKESYGSEEDRRNNRETVGSLTFSDENFDQFSVSDTGVVIFYDAGFPHVIQALEPEGRYFFTWKEIKPFIKPDGLLGKFVR